MKYVFRRSRRRKPNRAEQIDQPFFSRTHETPKTDHSGFFQTKLKVGKAGDQFEQEADAVAQAVVHGSDGPAVQAMEEGLVQRYMTNAEFDERGTNTERIEEDKRIQEKPLQKQEEEEPVQMQASEEEEVQMQAAQEEEEPVQMQAAQEEEEPVQMQAAEEEDKVSAELQRKEDQVAGGARPSGKERRTERKRPSLEAMLMAARGKGMPLPKDVRVQMETKFGADFRKVRIHTGDYAVRMARLLGANAFTRGCDIFFNEGKYDLNSSGGLFLLAHELTHVVQQKGR